MSYYQSNYPGQTVNYYGQGARYQEHNYGNSAYNVNQYGHQQPQYGGGYSYVAGQNQSGAVPGFTVPAVQQFAQMNQGLQAPPAMQMPASGTINHYDNHLMQFQMQQQQMLQMQQMQMMQTQMMMMNQSNKGNNDNGNDDNDGDNQQQSTTPSISEEEIREQVRIKMKESFVNELVRREKVSGTFEMTSGTVKPLGKYPADDPVVEWFKENKDQDLADTDWSDQNDCIYLRDAMKGTGTNEDAIIHIVSTRCNEQRQKLKKSYKTSYGRDLIEDIKSELSGDFREAVMACFVKPAVYDAWCIKEAIYGPGTDEETLVEILMTRTNAQINEMKEAYGDVVSPNRKTKDTILEKDIEEDTSGDFKRLLISAAQGNRNEIKPGVLESAVREIVTDEGEGTGMYEVNYDALTDMDQARRDAEELYQAGEARWGTDEETFNRIFSTRDYYSLRAIWKEYVKITQRDILNSVDRETSGDFKSGLRAIVMNIRCRPMFFAEKLMRAMKGLGTADQTIIRVIVSRSEIDMEQIKECFLQLTEKTLWKWLEHDCSGDYKKLLQKLVGRD